MNYLILTASGVLIGLLVAAPIGPVNLICIRRTLHFGPLNGFIAGLGAAIGDGIFATIAAFGLTAVAAWIEGFSTVLQIGGGSLLIGFGVHTFLTNPFDGKPVEQAGRDPGRSSLVRTMASTFVLAISNPATLFAFAALFTGIGGLTAGTDPSLLSAGCVVVGVWSGSALWWFTVTTVVGLLHARIDAGVMRVINHVSGIAICLFGVAVLGHVVFTRIL